jgi:hypothetical protein
MILDEGGACIVGATATVVRGQRLGQSITQTPCDAWAYGGGFVYKDLTPGVEMTFVFLHQLRCGGEDPCSRVRAAAGRL